MKKSILIITMICGIFLLSCSNSIKVDRFLDNYEKIVKKYEAKQKDGSLNLYITQIKNDNDELVKMSNKIRSSYPVSKWEKSKIERFKDLGDRFMLLRLKSGGGVDYTPRPYDGYNH